MSVFLRNKLTAAGLDGKIIKLAFDRSDPVRISGYGGIVRCAGFCSFAVMMELADM